MTNNIIPQVDYRYILYDGYNQYEVERWLAERAIKTDVNSRNSLLYVSKIENPFDVTVVRPREYLFIEKGELIAVSLQHLISEHLNLRNPESPTFRQRMRNYNRVIRASCYRT